MLGWQLIGLLTLILSIMLEDDRLFRAVVIMILFAIIIALAK